MIITNSEPYSLRYIPSSLPLISGLLVSEGTPAAINIKLQNEILNTKYSNILINSIKKETTKYYVIDLLQ